MKRDDARKATPETLNHLRRQAVRLSKAKKTQAEIGDQVGVRRETVNAWFKIYRQGGIAALKVKPRGRPKGSGQTLTPKQEAEIRKVLVDRTPDHLKFPFVLWTRKAVQMAIEKLFGIVMPIRTVGEYLKRWGFTPQKPAKRAYEQRPAEVGKWLKEAYPAIAKRARKEGAEIQWGDETGFQNTAHQERGYAPRGETPIIRLPAKKATINMISTVTNQGKVRFMLYRETMTATVLEKFLSRLVRDTKRKVFLILDNLRVHHAGRVREWLEKRRKRIEVFYLPSYSPELNSDEYLNCDLKGAVHSGIPVRDQGSLAKKVLGHMRKLQKSPDRVRKYFKHPRIQYADK